MDPMMTLPAHDRYPYCYIDDRPDYSWPGGKRLAFFVCTNLEYFAFKAGDGALDNAEVNARQTHRNYAWRDYGLRVGLSYLLDMLDELGIPAAHNTNSMLYDYRAAIFPRIRKRGDEIVAHGRTNAEHQDHMWELDEARMIKDVTDAIARHEGKPPAGWMGPGLAESSVSRTSCTKQVTSMRWTGPATIGGWYGMLAPAGTPAAIVGRLQREIAMVLRDAEVIKRFATEGVEVVGNQPQEFAAFLKSERAKWAKAVQLSGAKAD